jgi:hypothetical protein
LEKTEALTSRRRNHDPGASVFGLAGHWWSLKNKQKRHTEILAKDKTETNLHSEG